MSEDTDRLIALAQLDGERAEDWFRALHEAQQGDGDEGEASSWEEFGERLKGKDGIRPQIAEQFLRDADDQFSNPLDVLSDLTRQTSPDEAVRRHEELAQQAGAVDGQDQADDGGMEAFRVFLVGAGEYAGSPWPEYREWLIASGAYEGHSELTEAFVVYVEATDLPSAFTAYGVEVPPAALAVVEVAEVAEVDDAARAQAAAEALALGRRAVAALEEQIGQPVVVTDAQLASIVDQQIKDLQGA